MTWIALNEMTSVNGARPANADETHCYFWAAEFAASHGITTAAARGVAGSLSKKGLAYFQQDEDETLTGLTELGFRAWDEANPEPKAATPQPPLEEMDTPELAKALEGMSIAELTAVYNKAKGKNVKKPKGSKAAIITEIRMAQTPPPPPSTLRPERKRGPSSKDVLRSFFDRYGKVTRDDIETIADRLGVKAATVKTALVDLRHPVYAKGPVVEYEKNGDEYSIVARSGSR